MGDDVVSEQAFWDRFARHDPLWAILSDPSKAGRRWDLRSFLETGRREVSLLMYQLRALGLSVRRDAALDFGCGVGRLTQPLAGHFDRVVGVDVSPEMIRLADQINQHSARVRYVCNARDDLTLFAAGEFTFMYSNVVLQHVEPARTLQYLRELLRVVSAGGLLVFQLPSHRRAADEPREVSRPMADDAYRAAIRIDGDLSEKAAPQSELILTVAVTNISRCRWSQLEAGAIRVGNHWLDRSGRTMLIQDDGRARLPEVVEPGQTCRVALTVRAPTDAGEYLVECDVVHEGISWFGDKGSTTCRCPVRVGGGSSIEAPGAADDLTPAGTALALPDVSSTEEPGLFPMHGVHRDIVTSVVEEGGATLVHVEADERCGKEWVGYRYFVRKH